MDGYDVTLSKDSYSAPLIEKIIKDAQKKGGKLQRSSVPWHVVIRFPSSQAGAEFWNSLPKADKG